MFGSYRLPACRRSVFEEKGDAKSPGATVRAASRHHFQLIRAWRRRGQVSLCLALVARLLLLEQRLVRAPVRLLVATLHWAAHSQARMSMH
jgi:hypothetical protein